MVMCGLSGGSYENYNNSLTWPFETCIPYILGSFNFYNVAVIFTKSDLQFFNNDLSEYYHNYNDATADVFADLVKMEFANNLHVQRGTAKD